MMKNIYFFLLLFYIFLGSCSQGEAAPAAALMLGSSSRGLLFINCKAVSENEIEFEFSAPVTVKSVNFEPALSVASIENGSTVKVKLSKVPKPGELIIADLLAEDADRNTINVLAPFRSRNNRMPKLVINELCLEATSPKTEFIEFKLLSDGNLGAMRIVIQGNTKATKRTVYEFLPVEVKVDKDEARYVTLHLRTREESSVNEYYGDIAESRSVNSSPLAWDFFMPGSVKYYHEEASAVYVLDQDDKVLDAVMISATDDSEWKMDHLTETAEFLFKQGAWKSAKGKICYPADSVMSLDAAATRTICRDETVADTNTAADWYITVQSGATPGKPNNTKRYSK